MKKILFGTTALLAANAFSASAQASDPIKLDLGGFMMYYVAAADQDDDAGLDTNSVDVLGDAEVWFTGSTTLDNGMKIAVQVELEAGTGDGDDDIDESYMTLSGKYGELIVGSTDDAAVRSAVFAPSVSPLGTPGDGPDFEQALLIPDTVSYIEIGDTLSGDANKLTYFTPRYYGLQAGVSYVPSNEDIGDDNGATVTRNTDSFDNIWAFALNYSEEFSGVGVDASASYVVADDQTASTDNDSNEVENYSFGLNLSYQGFTFGGGYMVRSANFDTNYGAGDGYSWNVGASYEEGPYGVSLAYYNSEVEGLQTDNDEDSLQEIQLAGTYALGAGVDLFAEVDYLDAEDESDAEANGNEGAYAGIVGLSLTF